MEETIQADPIASKSTQPTSPVLNYGTPFTNTGIMLQETDGQFVMSIPKIRTNYKIGIIAVVLLVILNIGVDINHFSNFKTNWFMQFILKHLLNYLIYFIAIFQLIRMSKIPIVITIDHSQLKVENYRVIGQKGKLLPQIINREKIYQLKYNRDSQFIYIHAHNHDMAEIPVWFGEDINNQIEQILCRVLNLPTTTGSTPSSSDR